LDLTAAYSATYDAWNRLVEVKDGSNVVLKCEYDGLGRRTKTFVNTSDPLDQTYDAFLHFFYNSGWQILETRKSTSENTGPETLQPEYQYVWSERYIDAPVLRDENTDQDDLCDDQRLYYTTDANMNVTALLDTAGDAVERYVYNPYGEVEVLDADFSADGDGESDYGNAILYCGYYHDSETGLYHVRHRMYHATLGRWIQRDPAGYGDGLCLYAYVAGNPSRLLDPLGLHHIDGNDIVVERGDTMWDIARQETGEGANYRHLGPPPSGDYDKVYPGDRIPITAQFRRTTPSECALDGHGAPQQGPQLPQSSAEWLAFAKGLAPPHCKGQVHFAGMQERKIEYGPKQCPDGYARRLVWHVEANRLEIDMLSLGGRLGSGIVTGGEDPVEGLPWGVPNPSEWRTVGWLDIEVYECICNPCSLAEGSPETTTVAEEDRQDSTWRWHDVYWVHYYKYVASP